MKSKKTAGLSQQFLKNDMTNKLVEPSYSNIIKIPLAPSSSIISEEVTKKLFALKDNAGLSPVENRVPLRLLLNDPGSDINQNVPLILGT